MAEFLVRNSLNPHKVVKLGVTFRQLVDVNRNDGDPIWVVEVATDEPHKDGGGIRPTFINLISLEHFDDEMDKAVAEISEQIDWTPLDADQRAPYADSIRPSDYTVEIRDFVEVVLKDNLPSAGIDINSIEMTINGFDVTTELEITGDPYEYTVKWDPSIRVYDTY